MESVRLHIENVRKNFGARAVLRGLSFAAVGGEVLAIVGPNGTGKSTLLKIVAGLLRPSAGQVTITFGQTTVRDAVLRRRLIGYAAPDIAFYPELSARENLQFFADVRGEGKVVGRGAELLQQVGLAGREDDPVSAYSSGMRQRLRLAFALLHRPPVLLLDEPSLALDETGSALVGSIIAAQKASGGLTVLATNDAQEAALGDRRIIVGTAVLGNTQKERPVAVAF